MVVRTKTGIKLCKDWCVTIEPGLQLQSHRPATHGHATDVSGEDWISAKSSGRTGLGGHPAVISGRCVVVGRAK